MNNNDKMLYKALKFYAGISIGKAQKLKKENPSEYYKYTSESLESVLHSTGFIHFGEDKMVSSIKLTGLEQLRILEDIRRKDLTLIASVIAVIISLVALAKSMG